MNASNSMWQVIKDWQQIMVKLLNSLGIPLLVGDWLPVASRSQQSTAVCMEDAELSPLHHCIPLLALLKEVL